MLAVVNTPGGAEPVAIREIHAEPELRPERGLCWWRCMRFR